MKFSLVFYPLIDKVHIKGITLHKANKLKDISIVIKTMIIKSNHQQGSSLKNHIKWIDNSP